jgi:hypothetical protein
MICFFNSPETAGLGSSNKPLGLFLQNRQPPKMGSLRKTASTPTLVSQKTPFLRFLHPFRETR